MVRPLHLLPAISLWLCVIAAVCAQDPLPDLPRPLDTPHSLYLPAPPPTPEPAPESPYFERDPLLDPPDMPRPGWFFDGEASALHAHFKNRLAETVPIGNAPPTPIQVAGADLNWTVSSRIEVGYRLESGFGEFSLSYRTLATSGSQDVVDRDGPAAARSVLDFDVLDFDYGSREFSLWPCCELKWFIGVRNMWSFYGAQDNESFATAAAGSGLLTQRVTNSFSGAGPHIGFEVERQLGESGWSLSMKVDGAGAIGWLHQKFIAQDTTGAMVEVRDSSVANVAMVHGEIGLGWRSGCGPRHVRVFAGYEYEYWWDIGRMDASIANSRADMSNQGFVVRAGLNY